jgi:MFS transporter, DHA1 family, multidrug resistance protein
MSSQAARFLDRHSPPHIVTLATATAFGALAMNIFLPSLPGIAKHFGTDYAIAQLAVTLYLFANAGLQLIIGPLSDRYGRRSVMLFFMGVALAATVMAIFAPTIEVFLAARLLQGCAIAGMVIGRAVIRDMVSANEAASMIGYVTMAMTLAPMVGPVIGGYLDELYGWQASFMALFVFGAAAMLLVFSDLGETHHNRAASLTAQIALMPQLFSSLPFWLYCATAAFSSGAFFAFVGGGPYVASAIFGLSPSQYGFYFAFAGIGYIIGNFISGRYAARIGIERMMLAGALVTTAGMGISALLILAGFTHPLTVFAPVVTVGLGNGITLPSANAGIVSVRPQLSGAASGLGGFLQIGGGAMLSILAGMVLGPDTGPMPLVLLMLVSAILSGVSTLAGMAVRGARSREA